MNNNNGNFFLGLILGAAAGAALGFLSQTPKGKEVRRNIGAKARELSDELGDNLGECGRKVMEKASDLGDKVTDHVFSGEEIGDSIDLGDVGDQF